MLSQLWESVLVGPGVVWPQGGGRVIPDGRPESVTLDDKYHLEHSLGSARLSEAGRVAGI